MLLRTSRIAAVACLPTTEGPGIECPVVSTGLLAQMGKLKTNRSIDVASSDMYDRANTRGLPVS